MRLRVYDAGPARVERIRARCVSALEARRRETEAVGSQVSGRRAWLEPALAVGLGVLYLADAVVRALAVCR
jgi:hypothetical protein